MTPLQKSTESFGGSSNTARVAIIIPCFNDGSFVTDALDSARQQEPSEIIIVDDGSTDPQTRSVLRELEASGVRVLGKENGGLASARMTGVAATSARYIQPLDADDRLEPGAVTVLADALDADPAASAAWGTVEAFGTRDCRYNNRSGIDPWRLSYMNELPAVPMLRRASLLAVGGWDWHGWEDWDLAMKGAEAGWKGIKLEQVYLHYREHAKSRLYDQVTERQADYLPELRERHADLIRGRAVNRRRSDSTRPVKLLWPLVDRLPFASEAFKSRCVLIVRDHFEPWMATSDTPRLGQRIRRKLLKPFRGRQTVDARGD
jgi:glycosyltransferase involved in cell wall biosynthesis